jgi:hypothetical protein
MVMEELMVKTKGKGSMKDASCVMFEKKDLVQLKLRAMRRGVWFRALSRIDRVLLELTVSVVPRVRSFKLAKILSTIVERLEDALEGRVLHVFRKFGFQLARRISSLAQKWGNRSAQVWAYDMSFARFLAIMRLNNAAVCSL